MYDEVALKAVLAMALQPFMPPGTLDVGKQAVVDIVTDTALRALTIICGESSITNPRGVLFGYPIIEHAPCDAPTCGLPEWP